MSVLDEPTPSEPTTAEKQLRAKNRLSQLALSSFKHLLNTHTEAISCVWDNPLGLTPEEVVEGLGEDAAELFTLTYQLATFINTIKPDTITFTMPKAATLNEDGTVTLSDLE